MYIDSSALVKRYVAELDSERVAQLIREATAIGTSIISRAEVAAALAKAVRMKYLPAEEADSALKAFNKEWKDLIRLQMSELLVERAASLAWDQGLRGYDAMHLAAALFWQEMLGERVTMATYDRQLLVAADQMGLALWPEQQP